MLLTILGVFSALLFLAGDWFYIRDTVYGLGRPHRIAYGIFTLINGVDIANQIAIGASSSLWLFGAAMITTAIIFVLSFPKGVGGSEPLDWIVLAGCVAGVVLWAVSRNPLVSVWTNLIVVTLAMIPVIKKSYLSPHEEPMLPWLLCGLAGLVSAASVGQYSMLLLLPLHGAIIELATYALIRTRRRQLGLPAAERPDGDIPALV